MTAGAAAIAFSSVGGKEHGRWHEAAHREGRRYGVSAEYIRAGLAGEDSNTKALGKRDRTWLDWSIVAVATAVFVGLAAVCRVPEIALNWTAVSLLTALLLVFLLACGTALWNATRFS